MKILDEKFFKQPWRFVYQCALATVTIVVLLFLLDVSENTAVIASLGATAFIIFAMPRAKSSDPKRVLGGYLIGILAGCLFSFLTAEHLSSWMLYDRNLWYIVSGGLAVGVSIFLMVITNAEHPPAAGIALGLVINDWEYRTLLIISAAVVIMSLVRRLLKRHMTDLV